MLLGSHLVPPAAEARTSPSHAAPGQLTGASVSGSRRVLHQRRGLTPSTFGPVPLPGVRRAASRWGSPAAAGQAAGAEAGSCSPELELTYLRHLKIKDFALVAEQRVTLHPGLNVITGAVALLGCRAW